MTHVITGACIGARHKELSCTEVCPMNCIHGTADDATLYIDPEECIDCGACVPACPREAIFPEDDLPENWQNCLKLNADYFRGKK